ncbi:MAG: DEAD/DEAH box helicase [Fibrobacteria bacterium]|nr:DEAD/DEAH box helicase [Fibrobacteria bacterium]
MENGPIIVQGDMTILVEVSHSLYAEVRDQISPFTELVKSPEHMHTYVISPLSLWNAASAGHKTQKIIDVLRKYSRYELPFNLVTEVQTLMDRYGKIRLVKENNEIILETDDSFLMSGILNNRNTKPYLGKKLSDTRVLLQPMSRGHLKMELTRIGFPAEDLAGYAEGDKLTFSIRDITLGNKPLKLRHYQKDSSQVFFAGGSEKGGSGIIVLPCGSGKTVVGMAAMEKCQCQTLILTTNVVATRQWVQELLDKTTLESDQVGEYNGSNKSIRPVTVATYQILTYRKRKTQEYPHFDLFQKNKWGLIIYDEVHLLPAPIFRLCADVQATRRLGLTATLIREDGKETDVFSLIGPKKFDIPWKILETQGWIAKADCTEIRVSLASSEKITYAMSEPRTQITIAASNSLKNKLVKELLITHKKDQILIIGQYIAQLEKLAKEISVPLITGSTPNNERVKLYKSFREGDMNILMVSKVGNFAIDLPDANVLIQISGTFGSRQEEAQRLGRLLRPKPNENTAHFYSIVTKETKEQVFAMNRQLFLTEQGYNYTIKEW